MADHRPRSPRDAVNAVMTASPGTRSTSATSAPSRSATTTPANAFGGPSAARLSRRSRTSSSELHDEIKAGIWTPATYTVKQCVMDWLDSLELDPHTMATYRGQAEKWIYPKIGATKLKDFKATDADRFLRDVAKVLSKSSLVKIKSTLVRSIRRAQKYDLIGRNVAELVDLPQGQPGHPSRAMTEEQASKVLKAASGQPTGFVKVVKVSQGKYAATHAATETGELACGTWTRLGAPVTEIGTDLATTTCRVLPRAARHSTTTRTLPAGSKRCSCCRSRSACARANCASSPGITSTSTTGSSTCGGRRAGPATSRRRSPSARSRSRSAPSPRSRRTRSARPPNG